MPSPSSPTPTQERCVTPTSPNEVARPSESLELTQSAAAEIPQYFNLCGSELQLSESFMQNLDEFENYTATQFQNEAAPTELPASLSEESAPPLITYDQIEIIGDFLNADELSGSANRSQVGSVANAAGSETCERPTEHADGDQASSCTPEGSNGLEQTQARKSDSIPDESPASSNTTTTTQEEGKRPRRARKRTFVENDENEAPAEDVNDENWTPRRPKRRVQSMAVYPVSEPKTRAMKRKSSTPLGDITNIKALKASESDDVVTPKPDPVPEREEIESCRKEVERLERSPEIPSPLSDATPYLVPSPILALLEFESPESTNKLYDVNVSSAKHIPQPLLDREDFEAAETLVKMATPVKISPRIRTPIVYAANDHELLMHGVNLRMICYDDSADDLSFSLENRSELQTTNFAQTLSPFTTNVRPVDNFTPPFIGSLNYLSQSSPSVLNTSFRKLAEFNSLIHSLSQTKDDDLGLNIVREMPRHQTPPRRQSEPSEPADSAECSEGELEESSLISAECDDNRSTLIAPDEIEEDLKATAKKLEQEIEDCTAEDMNQLQYALVKFHEFFTEDELKNGILGDPKGKCRSKTRQVLDPERANKVKDAVKDKFNLDAEYTEILWSNMRSELNKRISKPLKKPRKQKAAQTPSKQTLKVKLFKAKQ